MTEYRQLANPKQLNRFLDGGGALANRDEIADRFDYDWHARKLTFESHFRSHVLLHITKYTSARDLQWAMREAPLFEAAGVHVEISVPGLTQANAQRPLEPYLVMLQQVMDAVARLPYRRLRRLDKKTWQSIVKLLNRVDLVADPHPDVHDVARHGGDHLLDRESRSTDGLGCRRYFGWHVMSIACPEPRRRVEWRRNRCPSFSNAFH